jgi:hypothetical protein
MTFYLSLNAVLRHPLNREKRREFRSNPDSLLDDVARQARREVEETKRQLGETKSELEQTRMQLYIANSSVERALARGGDLEAGLLALRSENATLTERAAIAAEVKTALTRVASSDQLADARDRLAGRLELLTSELVDVRRSIDSAGQQDGSDETRRLYLDLLEAALTGILTRDGNAAPWGGEEFDPDRRLYGRDWPKSAMTMIGTARMRNLRRLVETVLAEGVAGDVLEAGVWRGGACIYMRGILAAHAVKNRTVWVADSFAGLPEPDETLYPADKGDTHYTSDELRASLDEVKDNFQRFGLLDEQVAFLPGWFKDTLPQAPIEHLSVLRLDGDMYGSTMETLQALYARVSRGGFIIVDDYILPGCRRAVDDFREQRRIEEPLHDVDGAAAYWKRT